MRFEALKCDVCHKVVPAEDGTLKIKRKEMDYGLLGSHAKWQKLDVCPDCAKLIYRFIREANLKKIVEDRVCDSLWDTLFQDMQRTIGEEEESCSKADS